MKTFLFLFIALSLPFLGHFQEMRVFKDGKVIFEQSVYGQSPVAELMIAVALVLGIAAWQSRKKVAPGRMAQLVRFSPALFALPATWQSWSVSQFGGPDAYTEIKSGLGGPMTPALLIAAAVLFVALDAYWRQKESA